MMKNKVIIIGEPSVMGTSSLMRAMAEGHEVEFITPEQANEMNLPVYREPIPFNAPPILTEINFDYSDGQTNRRNKRKQARKKLK